MCLSSPRYRPTTLMSSILDIFTIFQILCFGFWIIIWWPELRDSFKTQCKISNAIPTDTFFNMESFGFLSDNGQGFLNDIGIDPMESMEFLQPACKFIISRMSSMCTVPSLLDHNFFQVPTRLDKGPDQRWKTLQLRNIQRYKSWWRLTILHFRCLIET